MSLQKLLFSVFRWDLESWALIYTVAKDISKLERTLQQRLSSHLDSE